MIREGGRRKGRGKERAKWEEKEGNHILKLF
jgi:hypothetical protein